MEAREAPKPKTFDELTDDVKENMSFKEQQERKLQDKAEDDTGWNTLFIRSDVAIEALADQLGIAKSDILDREASDSLAVRVAAAETEIIHQTKKWLEERGVDISVFKSE